MSIIKVLNASPLRWRFFFCNEKPLEWSRGCQYFQFEWYQKHFATVVFDQSVVWSVSGSAHVPGVAKFSTCGVFGIVGKLRLYVRSLVFVLRRVLLRAASLSFPVMENVAMWDALFKSSFATNYPQVVKITYIRKISYTSGLSGAIYKTTRHPGRWWKKEKDGRV